MLEEQRLEFISLEDKVIDISVVKLIPEEIAISNCIIAFNDYEDYLCVAVSKQPDILVHEELEFIIGKSIKFFYSTKNQIVNAINIYYCKNNVEKAVKNIESKNKFYINKEKFQTIEEENLQQFPVVKLANYVINAAICKGASDIHLEPFQNHILVRFRIDGIIKEFIPIPQSIYSLICTRIKIMAIMDIAEKRVPQDGKIKYTCEYGNYDLRVSTLPTVHGEKIAIRILYKSEEMRFLKSLGFYNEDIENIKSMLSNSNGIILVTGPTGSGKTTTLYSMINMLNKKEKNITSIEDPVEYTLDNVNQVNVNSKIGFNFAEGLRSILRQDPDVIMVGEIRDEETAQIAIRSAVTGHLVISTLHTNDAAEAVIRLKDMGIPLYFIEDAVIGVIAQRLVRKICNECKREYFPSEYEKRYLNLGVKDKLYKGEGCSRCYGTGYSGRTVVCEIINLKELKKKGFRLKESAGDLRKHNFKKGIGSIGDNCIKLVKSGITTYEEIIRINL